MTSQTQTQTQTTGCFGGGSTDGVTNTGFGPGGFGPSPKQAGLNGWTFHRVGSSIDAGAGATSERKSGIKRCRTDEDTSVPSPVYSMRTSAIRFTPSNGQWIVVRIIKGRLRSGSHPRHVAITGETMYVSTVDASLHFEGDAWIQPVECIDSLPTGLAFSTIIGRYNHGFGGGPIGNTVLVSYP